MVTKRGHSGSHHHIHHHLPQYLSVLIAVMLGIVVIAGTKILFTGNARLEKETASMVAPLEDGLDINDDSFTDTEISENVGWATKPHNRKRLPPPEKPIPVDDPGKSWDQARAYCQKIFAYNQRYNIARSKKCYDCYMDPGEECEIPDHYVRFGGGYGWCNPRCKAVVCGNGFIERGEECDDGNTQNGDYCRYNCKIESVCTPVDECIISSSTSSSPTGHVISDFGLGSITGYASAEPRPNIDRSQSIGQQKLTDINLRHIAGILAGTITVKKDGDNICTSGNYCEIEHPEAYINALRLADQDKNGWVTSAESRKAFLDLIKSKAQ